MKNSDKKSRNVIESMGIEIDALIEAGLLPVGHFVTIETINPIYHGRLVGVTASYYMLAEVSWLGDVGQRAEYEHGASPAEANYISGSDEHPFLIERSACLTGPCLAHVNLQKALSK